MVGCKIQLKKKKPAAGWVSGLLGSKFFDTCVNHGELRKNEKNLFCIDCNICFCKHCATSSAHDCPHRLLQICKYVYRDVVRIHDIQPYLDCSLIQAYKINGEKAVHLQPRLQLKDAKRSNSKTKGGGTCCEACGRHIQDLPNRFCSIACKVTICAKITTNQSHNIISTMTSNVDHIPSLETVENSYDNGYASSLSLTDSSSEVIQALWPEQKMLHKRKGLPRRAPMF